MGAHPTQPRNKWIPRAYVGGESITYPNGMIFKSGLSGHIAANNSLDITYGTPFPSGIKSMACSYLYGATTYNESCSIKQKVGSLLSVATIRNDIGATANVYWQAWGW